MTVPRDSNSWRFRHARDAVFTTTSLITIRIFAEDESSARALHHVAKRPCTVTGNKVDCFQTSRDSISDVFGKIEISQLYCPRLYRFRHNELKSVANGPIREPIIQK